MLLSRELLAKVKKIQIKTDRMATGLLSGEYQSAFKGKGLNFDSLREYYPGDDIRMIDWKVTARMSEPFIKQYREERQLSIILMLDLSASNEFGTCNQNKEELAIELSAVLASAAVRNNDKVGLIIFTDDVEYFLPPKQGRAHIFKLIRDLMTFQAKSKKTDLKKVLSSTLSMIPRNSVVFLISDFMPMRKEDGFENFERELKIFREAQDLIALSIRDPREFSLPNIGYVEAVNPETGRKELLNLNKKSIRDSFTQVQNQYFEALKHNFFRNGVDFLDIRTNGSYVHQLLTLFMTREKRKK